MRSRIGLRKFGLAFGFMLAIIIGGAVAMAPAYADTQVSGLILSVDANQQNMLVATADGKFLTVRWNGSTRMVTDNGRLPWQASVAQGARVELSVNNNGMAQAITVRSQLDEAAWHISKIVNCFRVKPDYVSRLHTEGHSFDDIVYAFAIEQETGADPNKVIAEANHLTWDQIAARYRVSTKILDYWAERTFSDGSTTAMGGPDTF